LCELGINPENFNPRVLYAVKIKKKDSSDSTSSQTHDYASIIYMISGECAYNINDTLYPVKKDDIIILNPDTPHSCIMKSGKEVVQFHAGIDNIFIESLPKGYLIAKVQSPVVRMDKYSREFIKCYNEILVEQEKGEPGCCLMIKSLFMKLIILIIKETYASDYNLSDDSINFEPYDRTTIINSLMNYMDENYMQQISLDKISRNMYLSPAYISKVFKEETGESPINYLIKTRLSKACEMLKKDSLSIKQISKGVGYEDAYYFSKLFKKYYGVPPSKYTK
jgi:AraC-like DNA-binding protein